MLGISISAQQRQNMPNALGECILPVHAGQARNTRESGSLRGRPGYILETAPALAARRKGRLVAVLLAGFIAGCADNTAFVGNTGTTQVHQPLTRNSSTTACPVGQVCGGIKQTMAGAGGQPGSGATPTPGPSPSPSVMPASSPSPGAPGVQSVAVSPTFLVLNAPDLGGTSAGFTTSGQLAATVTLSDTSTSDAVLWSSNAPGVVTVSASGTLNVEPGAQPQAVKITAAALADPGQNAVAIVTVEASGVLNVGIQ